MRYYDRAFPGKRWVPLLIWACKGAGQPGYPRHRRAVRYLAARAIDIEVALARL
jgi:hypothetical protein